MVVVAVNALGDCFVVEAEDFVNELVILVFVLVLVFVFGRGTSLFVAGSFKVAGLRSLPLDRVAA